MTEPLNPPTPDEPTPDETFTWTNEGGPDGRLGRSRRHGRRRRDRPRRHARARRSTTATAILESLREAVDDLAERATPTVREFSARAAELAAVAADRAAPLARRAGEVTADASGKLADEVADLGGGPPRRRSRRTTRRPPAAETGPAPPTTPHPATRRRMPTTGPIGRPESGLISHAILRAMSVRPIVLLGDPRLRLKGKPVDSFGKYLHELLDDLAHTMRDAPGVGLAAPQLGEAMQACVIEVEGQLYELVNPRIVRATGDDRDLEGCLSIPGYVAYVTRRERVWVVAQDRQGKKIKVAGSGLLGRALQHELDHLDGKLYIDYLESMDELMAVGAGERGRRGGPRGDERPGVTDGRAGGSRVRTVFLGSGGFGRPEPARASPSTPTSSSSASSRAPPRPAGARQRPSPTDDRRRRRASSGVATVLTPARLRDAEAVARCSRSNPSSLVLADYGQIVPPALLELPHGALNLHPSLLPRHRGATPIPAAILAGDAETGVTLMRMDAGLDTGPIVAQDGASPLTGAETAPELEARARRGRGGPAGGRPRAVAARRDRGPGRSGRRARR